jgi:glutathione S-transferase
MVSLIITEYPYNKIPNMVIEGQLVHQSMAIARYFARQVGLAGQDATEQLQCDIMVDTLTDYRLRESYQHKEVFSLNFNSRFLFH